MDSKKCAYHGKSIGCSYGLNIDRRPGACDGGGGCKLYKVRKELKFTPREKYIHKLLEWERGLYLEGADDE